MNPLVWLKCDGAVVLPAIAVGLVVAEPLTVRAQSTAGDEAATIEQLARTVEELQRELAERDAVIADMLRRVIEVERRLPGTATDQAASPAQPTLPLPAPVQREGQRLPGVAEGGTAAEATPAPAPAAPGQIEVDQEATSTALERALVQEGALLLPAGTVQVEPSLSYTRQEADAPAFVLQETDRVAADDIRQDILTAGLTLRLGLPFDSQLTLSIPYRHRDTSTVTRLDFAGIDEENDTASGFGDLAVTASKGLLRERGWRPDVIAEVSWNTDTGETDDGVPLGSEFDELTVGVTASKSQDPLVFVGGVSYSHAFEDGGIQPGDVFGLSLGTVLAASPETSLRFFVDNAFFMDTEVDGRNVPGSDEAVALFSVGASSILSSWA